jgi:hypothetical protein
LDFCSTGLPLPSLLVCAISNEQRGRRCRCCCCCRCRCRSVRCASTNTNTRAPSFSRRPPSAVPLTHSLSRSFTQSVARSLSQSFARSLIQSLVHSVSLSLAHSVSRLFGNTRAAGVRRLIACQRPSGQASEWATSYCKATLFVAVVVARRRCISICREELPRCRLCPFDI